MTSAARVCASTVLMIPGPARLRRREFMQSISSKPNIQGKLRENIRVRDPRGYSKNFSSSHDGEPRDGATGEGDFELVLRMFSV